MIAAVVLAAGASTRLGRPKALVEVDGRPLVARAAEAMSVAGCDPVVVVLGADADRVRPVLAGLPVRVVLHEGWVSGLAGSIAAGLREIASAAAVEAVLLAVCDQPALDAAVVRRLVDAWRGRPPGATAAACAYAGTLGTPAVFGRSRFAELGTLAGDRGAASLLRADPGRVATVAWPEGARDVDRPADLPRG